MREPRGPYRRLVEERTAAGATANEIQRAMDKAITTAFPDWWHSPYGDWLPDTVCSECGVDLGLRYRRRCKLHPKASPVTRREYAPGQAQQPTS